MTLVTHFPNFNSDNIQPVLFSREPPGGGTGGGGKRPGGKKSGGKSSGKASSKKSGGKPSKKR
jgi:hypothetical protein